MRLFGIPIFTFDPETKALLIRLLDFLEGAQQAQVDAMRDQVLGLTEKLKGSQIALKSAVATQQ